jgi:phosphoglycerate dehydrogenase-like enzyme
MDFGYSSRAMSNSSLRIWCNLGFTSDQERERNLLIEGVAAHRLLMFEEVQNGRDGDSRAALDTADIVFGYPDANAMVECERLRWVHLRFAGYTPYDHDHIRQSLIARGTPLTNSSSVYDEPCAQHVLAMILGVARGLPRALDVQRGDRSWPSNSLRLSLPLLNGQTILLLGFGAIGRRLVQMLQPLEVNLIAVRRQVRGDEPVQTVNTSSVDEVLPAADHIVNILPANDQTRNFLDAKRLQNVKTGAIVYNIGRGTTLDQAALLEGLQAGRIGAAYLDVTDPEPLPPGHPLWTAPNCYITPHLGGGHTMEQERLVKHFLTNLRRFERADQLLDRVF